MRKRKQTLKNLDCRACGVCCTIEEDVDYSVNVDEEDLDRLSPGFINRNVFRPNGFEGLYLRAVQRVQLKGPLAGLVVTCCAALRGSVLHRVSCSIYEHRPKACRDFKVNRGCFRLQQELIDEAERIRE